MRVLVTGAAGMLGLDVRAAGSRAGHEVVGVSRSELDITDAAAVRAVFERVSPDVVINCAAFTRVDAAEDDVAAAMAVNGHGPGVLASAAAGSGAWVVHVSTDYVFDGSKTSGPYVESDETGPRSIYGQSKLAGEWAVSEGAPQAHTIVRSSWLFGAGGPCFPATILRAAVSRPELKVVDDQVGTPTYTPHLAAALVALAERREVVGLAHVAGTGQCSWFEFASALVTTGRARTAAEMGSRAAAEGDPEGGDGWATVRPCSTAEYPTAAPRPAFSVLRSERDGVPVLAHWLAGMNDYMAERDAMGAER